MGAIGAPEGLRIPFRTGRPVGGAGEACAGAGGGGGGGVGVGEDGGGGGGGAGVGGGAGAGGGGGGGAGVGGGGGDGGSGWSCRQAIKNIAKKLFHNIRASESFFLFLAAVFCARVLVRATISPTTKRVSKKKGKEKAAGEVQCQLPKSIHETVIMHYVFNTSGSKEIEGLLVN